MRIARVLMVSFLFAACSSTTLTRTGPQVPARERNCDFQIFTALAPGYVEIGTIDYDYDGPTRISNLGEFKTRIQADVCAAGGDAAIAIANGYGNYSKASVLKASAPVSTPAAESAPPAPTGCQFDTQCKGDRICQQGACVDPPSTAPAK